MKKTIKIIAFSMMWISWTYSHAQNITCSDFAITGISVDASSSGNSLIDLFFGATPSDMVNYPYVSIVTDCNGDTVATGSMNFFGHLGQTEQAYPVTGDITNACLPLTCEFIYGNAMLENDTCFLIWGSTAGLSENASKLSTFSIFPNPASDLIQIQLNTSVREGKYRIYNNQGQLISTGQVLTENTTVDLSGFTNGIYFIRIDDSMEKLSVIAR